MPYAGPLDLIARYDVRSIGQLVLDDDTQANQAAIQSDPNVAAALSDASGMVDAACLVAGRYQPADLAGLSGNSQWLLKRLVCELAFTYLRRRRQYEGDELPEYEEALETLTSLRKGELIFGDVTAIIEAGVPKVYPLTAAIQAEQGIVSSVASTRYLPSRRYPS